MVHKPKHLPKSGPVTLDREDHSKIHAKQIIKKLNPSKTKK